MAHRNQVKDHALRTQIGSRFKQARENLRMTPERTALALGVTPATIGYWESGRSFPRVEHLNAMPSLYRVSLDGLLSHTSEEEFQEELFLATLGGADHRHRRAIARGLRALEQS